MKVESMAPMLIKTGRLSMEIEYAGIYTVYTAQFWVVRLAKFIVAQKLSYT